jgi:hypothetical protein
MPWSGPLQPCKPVHEHSTPHAPRAMPPRKRRQRAGGGPGVSGDDGAGPGPSSRVAGLLDVLDAVLAHGRLDGDDHRLLRQLCGQARLAVDGAIRTLDVTGGQDRASLRRFIAKLSGLHELEATWDAAVLSQVAACAPLRRMTLQLPQHCTHLGDNLGAMLAAFCPSLKVRSGVWTAVCTG